MQLSRRSGMPNWCCLLLLLQLFSDQQVRAEPRSLFIWGPLSTEYVTETAQFGDPLDEPVMANLMLPPDNPWLCEYPESLNNFSSAELLLKPEFQFDKSVALFVSINRCSAETKARVLAEMRERISESIKLLVLYSTNPQEFQFVSLRADSEADPEDLRDVGVLYIPHRYASGIDLRMRMQYQGDDPRFSHEGSEDWNFPIEVTALSDDTLLDRNESSGYSGGDIYWFRIILFSLLIASPCCRACYLWYAGGGRLHWRRNEQGRIVGIQYIPPMPLWLTTGRPPNDGPNPVGVLTEAEFNRLPEIVYEGVPEKDDSGTDGEGDDEDGNANQWNTAKIQSGTEDTGAEGSNVGASASSEVDVEAGESTPDTHTAPDTKGGGDKVSVEDVPPDGTALETHVNSECPTKDVPRETMDDGEFLDKYRRASAEQPCVTHNNGDFLDGGDDDNDDRQGEAEEKGPSNTPCEVQDRTASDEAEKVAESEGRPIAAQVAPELEKGDGAVVVIEESQPNVEYASEQENDGEAVVSEEEQTDAESASECNGGDDVVVASEENQAAAGPSPVREDDDEAVAVSEDTQSAVGHRPVREKDVAAAVAVDEGNQPATGPRPRPVPEEDEDADGAEPTPSLAIQTENDTTGHMANATDSVDFVPSANDAPDEDSVSEPSPAARESASAPAEPVGGENLLQGDSQTTSTACAICIDEFETGERLTLLPRCKHAFHRECIHAWLIERQGCCPLCKTDVLEPDPDNSPGELDIEAPAEQRYMMSSM